MDLQFLPAAPAPGTRGVSRSRQDFGEQLGQDGSSSFVVTGREHLSADPGGWLSSPFAFTTLGESFDASNTVAATPEIMPITTHDTGAVSLRRLTPAGFLMANFADRAATACHS